jgi:uncharacterized protein
MWCRWCGDDLEVTLRVQPRASRDGFVEAQDGCYRVRLRAPPVDGKANEALRRFVADAFGVSLSAVFFLSGEQSRQKRLLIRSPRLFPVPVAPKPD